MSQARLTLDNPAFYGTLRYKRRSVSYERRPMSTATIQDVACAKQNATDVVNVVSSAQRSRPHKLVFMDIKSPSRHKRAHSHSKPRVVQPASTVQPRPVAQKRRTGLSIKRLFRQDGLMYAAALIVFGLGMYVGLGGLRANNQVAVQVKTLQKQAVQGANTGSTDENAPPSTEKPTPAAVRSYAVSPVNPRYIDIPKLKVHARVLNMGVDRKNELQAPYGIHDAGWYNASSRPGENGAMLVDGHSGIGKTHGIFHDLMQLSPGDDIIVKRGDGQTYTYKVVRTEVLDVDKVNMGKLLVSENTAKPGLNLITCSGDQVPETFTLKQRAVAYAVMQ